MGVSRETEERFQVYLERLVFWQKSINLVSRETLSDLEGRHLLDSQQVGVWLKEILCGENMDIADLGSGAGFPGMVLAMMGIGRVALIEANGKRCAFLRDVRRATNTSVEIIQFRIEDIHNRKFDVVVSRALADLNQLLSYAHSLLRRGGICLFLKGKESEDEVVQAQINWNFSVERKRSVTNEDGVLLLISDLEKKT